METVVFIDKRYLLFNISGEYLLFVGFINIF